MVSLSTVLTSTVVSAIVAGFISIWTIQKNIRIKNITEERKEWREKIRSLTKEVNNLFFNNKFNDMKFLISDFETRLNPYDKDDEDQEILKVLHKMSEIKSIDKEIIEEFNIRISLLLKHDWERIKEEIEFLSVFKTKRKKYKELIQKEER